MKINVTVPRKYSNNKLIKDTRSYLKCYYNDEIAKTVFEGNEKDFYVYIKNRYIQIELVNDNENVINEVGNYLEHMFKDEYIGISTEERAASLLNIKNVKCFMI